MTADLDRDRTILRDLAVRYMELANDPIQDERRDLWRRHNGMERTHPLIYVRAFGWREMAENYTECVDPLLRHVEGFFRESLFRATLGDDWILEPWVTVRAAVVTPPEGPWGLSVHWSERTDPRGSRVWDPPLKDPADLARLADPHHVVDEEETARRVSRVQDAIGDIIPIEVDRKPAYFMWTGDISTELARLRGIEQMMLDMMDRPEWLHEVLAHMQRGILRTHEEAERAGHWTAASHQNQAVPYALGLPDPSANGDPLPRKSLWYYCASQETTLVGPRLFNEFMLQYQIPIMAPFGLTAYGCCEDLTQKIGLLRQIPNLRRIAVAPAANVARCAEQIGSDYITSYRPSPTDHVGYGWDPDRVRAMLREDLTACRANGCRVDVTLKDVETVQGDPDRVRNWVRVCREVIEETGVEG